MTGILDDNLSYLSFDSDGSQSSYKLHALDRQAIQKTRDTLEKLERTPQVYLCARGDCFKTPSAHDDFLNKDLAKLFIVGAKAKDFFDDHKRKETRYYEDPNVTGNDIKDELRSLITEFNKIMNSKPQSDRVMGQITKQCIDLILGESATTSLERWKIFFLSLLHNIGNSWDHKLSSPFLSLTYGSRKLAIAKKFALDRCKHDRGIIFFYSLNRDSLSYLLATDFAARLKCYGVSWYTDINDEVLLLKGMYPHYLIGILEVIKRCTAQRFILNPWIYSQFKQEGEFNYTEGVSINQRRFCEFAEQLGYQRWFFHEKGQELEWISDLSSFEPRRVYGV